MGGRSEDLEGDDVDDVDKVVAAEDEEEVKGCEFVLGVVNVVGVWVVCCADAVDLLFSFFCLPIFTFVIIFCMTEWSCICDSGSFFCWCSSICFLCLICIMPMSIFVSCISSCRLLMSRSCLSVFFAVLRLMVAVSAANWIVEFIFSVATVSSSSSFLYFCTNTLLCLIAFEISTSVDHSSLKFSMLDLF